jgi:hypothetical protein
VDGTVQDDEFLGLRSFVEMGSQAVKPWAVTARVVSRHDIELANFEFFRWPTGCGPQQDQAIDLAWLCDSGGGSGTASQTAPDRKDTLRTFVAQIMDGGQDIEMERSGEDVGLAGASRITVATKVDGQNTKPGLGQLLRLLLPTFLIEPASMSQHDTTVPDPVQVAMNETSVLRPKVDTLRRFDGLLPAWTVTNSE